MAEHKWTHSSMRDGHGLKCIIYKCIIPAFRSEVAGMYVFAARNFLCLRSKFAMATFAGRKLLFRPSNLRRYNNCRPAGRKTISSGLKFVVALFRAPQQARFSINFFQSNQNYFFWSKDQILCKLNFMGALPTQQQLTSPDQNK